MKISIFNFLRKWPLIAVLFAVMIGCQDDDPSRLTAEEMRLQSAIAAEETNQMIDFAQDAIEIASDVLDSEGITSGRAIDGVSSKKGHYDHHGCDPDVTTTYNVDKTHRDTLIYSGVISINYRDGATCSPRHVRKGQIINAFKYIYTWAPNSTWKSIEQLTFKDYVKDSAETNGIIQVTSHEATKTLKFDLSMVNYLDGLTRTSKARLVFDYHLNNRFKWKDNTITVKGKGSGTSRHGHAYDAIIQNPLLYKYSCDKDHRFFPVAGDVFGTINDAQFSISYGDGDCDRIYLITMNGETTEHTFGKDN